MRVIVYRPVDGKVDVRVDDRRGLTGMVLREYEVSREDLEATVGSMVSRWEKRRQDVLAAKKGKIP